MHPRSRHLAPLALALAAALVLGACAPATQSAAFGADVDVHLDGARDYHPRQAGIQRTYQAEGDPGRYVVTEQGPTLRDGLTQFVSHGIGLGRETLSYRTHTFPDKGVAHHDTIEYQYAVVAERSVTINGRTYDAFVIDFTATQASDGARIDQQHWYAPYVGVVRTVDQLYLTSTNLPGAPR